MALHHETLTFERTSDASPARLFDSYLDIKSREAWSAPSETAAVQIEDSDVRTGGAERTRCGGKDDLRFRTEVRYHLVETNARIVFTEALFHNDQLLTVSLVSFVFAASLGGGTKLTVTDQVTSFVGVEAIEGHRQGYSSSLDRYCARV